jgi:protein-tyrosine phosphatase
MTTDPPIRILVVCTGNIHRSALAAALLRSWSDSYLGGTPATDVEVGSAGTAAVVSARMDASTAAIARALKADGSSHRARQLSDAMIGTADLILTAEVSHRDDVVSRVPNAVRRAFTVREAGRAAAQLLTGDDLDAPQTRDEFVARVQRLALFRSAGDDDVIDPHRLPEEVSLQMTAELVPALAAVAQALLGMPAHAVDAYAKATTDPAMLRALIAAADQDAQE